MKTDVILKRIGAIIALFLWCFAPTIHAQVPMDSLLKWKEVLTFDVHYGMFYLGGIRIEAPVDTVWNGQKVIKLKTVAWANSSLPFVGYKEEHFYGIIAHNDTTFYELAYWKDDIDDEIMKQEYYEFDYELGKVFMWEEGEAKDTLDLDQPSIASSAFVYIVRMLTGTGAASNVQAYVGWEAVNMWTKFSSKPEKFKNKRVPNEYEKAYYVENKANLDGPFGFKGGFTGYMSVGDRPLPLLAKLKVWVGNVTVTLKSYERIR